MLGVAALGPLWPYWPFIRKLWWLLPVTALAITAATFRIQRDNAREDVAALEARVAAVEAAGRAQAEEARQSELAWQRAAERLVGETNARLDAVAADRESLARRLFEYADRARAGTLPGTPGGAGRGDGAAPLPGSPLPALDDYDRACRIDAEWLEFWVNYARTVGVPVAGTNGPN